MYERMVSANLWTIIEITYQGFMVMDSDGDSAMQIIKFTGQIGSSPLACVHKVGGGLYIVNPLASVWWWTEIPKLLNFYFVL